MGPPRTTSQPIQESCSGCSQGSNSAYQALLKVYARIQELHSGYSQGRSTAETGIVFWLQPGQQICFSSTSQGLRADPGIALWLQPGQEFCFGPPRAASQPILESRSGCSQGNNSASLALLQATRSSWPETLQSSAQFKTRSRPAQLKARSGLRPFAVQDSL